MRIDKAAASSSFRNLQGRNTKYVAYFWAHNGTEVSSIYKTARFTTSLKEGFIDSEFGTFAVSDVTPMPVENEAGFNLFTSLEGTLNVDVLDLTGSKVMNLNRFVAADTEMRIPLNFANLASGMYSVVISVGDDRMDTIGNEFKQ